MFGRILELIITILIPLNWIIGYLYLDELSYLTKSMNFMVAINLLGITLTNNVLIMALNEIALVLFIVFDWGSHKYFIKRFNFSFSVVVPSICLVATSVTLFELLFESGLVK